MSLRKVVVVLRESSRLQRKSLLVQLTHMKEFIFNKIITLTVSADTIGRKVRMPYYELPIKEAILRNKNV